MLLKKIPASWARPDAAIHISPAGPPVSNGSAPYPHRAMSLGETPSSRCIVWFPPSGYNLRMSLIDRATLVVIPECAAAPLVRPGSVHTVRAQFLKSAPSLRECPRQLQPEVAFAGRSNTGKSSILNLLTGSRLARASKTPGRTQLLNFFSAEGGGRLVDLPGFGYAKVSVRVRNAWERSVSDYLSHRSCLVGLFLVIDCRRSAQHVEKTILAWMAARELPVHLLFNKADKLSRSALAGKLRSARNDLQGYPHLSMQAISAYRKIGIEEALTVLDGWLRGSRTCP